MIRIAPDDIQEVCGYRVGTIVETVRVCRTGRLCHVWIAKRPLAVVIVPIDGVARDGPAMAFTPDGDVLSLDAVEKLCAGAVDRITHDRAT